MIQTIYTKYIEKNKKAVVSIGAAVALTLLVEYVYKKLTVPPKKYRAYPCITYIDLIKAAFKGETVYEQKKRIILPILNKANGVYMLPTHVGWQMRSTNPVINKTFMSDMELFPKAENMLGSGGSLVARFLGGDNVGTVEGDDWKRHRKIMNPAFHRALPVQTFGFLADRTFNFMEQNGLESIEIIHVCERMTLDAIGLAGFGFDFECSRIKDNQWLDGYDTIRTNLTKVFFILFQVFDDQLKWLFPARVDAHKKLDKLLGRIDEMITNRRKEVFEQIDTPEYQSRPTAEKDILTLMLEAEYAGEGKLSNKELEANISGFFFAGNDTTAVSLACAIGQLARNPTLQQKAREEVLSILGDGPEEVRPTTEEIREMKYVDAILKETLRLNSPLANTLPRVAAQDMQIDGVFIPKGTYIDCDVVGTHLSENNWKNAFEFDPSRFLGAADPTSSKEGAIWLPFGHGSHYCLGSNFSLYEQRVFLSMMLRRFEWELPADSIHKDGLVVDGYGVIRPVDLRVTFKKRF